MYNISYKDIPDELHEYYNWNMMDKFYYPTLKSQDSIYNKWDELVNEAHEIEYISIQEQTGEAERIKTDKYSYRQSKLGITGYVRPSFPFLNMRTFVIKEDADDEIRENNASNADGINLEALNSITAFRDSLMLQIKRQNTKAFEINKQIVDIIKCYDYEIIRQLKQARSDNGKEYFELSNLQTNTNHLLNEGILKGARKEDIIEHFLSRVIRSNKFISNYIINGSVYAIEKLATEREPYLSVAENLANKLNYVESIIEASITDQGLTDKFLKKRLMPSPEKVAAKVRDPKYDIEIIEDVMVYTRNYLINHSIDDVKGHINKIVKLSKQHITGAPHENTIRNWVKKYCAASKKL